MTCGSTWTELSVSLPLFWIFRFFLASEGLNGFKHSYTWLTYMLLYSALRDICIKCNAQSNPWCNASPFACVKSCMFMFLHYLQRAEGMGMMRRLCANAKPIFHLINSGDCPHSSAASPPPPRPSSGAGCLSDTYGLFSNPPGVSGHDLIHSRCMHASFQRKPL